MNCRRFAQRCLRWPFRSFHYKMINMLWYFIFNGGCINHTLQKNQNHGVYLNGENGNVKCCLQKKSVEVLRSVGAVNDSNCVDIDTGALIFSTEMMESLYSLIAAPEDYDRHVNARTRLSLYADFLYPLAEDSTLEDFYKEKPEGEFCPELTAARERVWNAF